jgi:hypothetical protein
MTADLLDLTWSAKKPGYRPHDGLSGEPSYFSVVVPIFFLIPKLIWVVILRGDNCLRSEHSILSQTMHRSTKLGY